jgi:hypothetical protein
VSYLVTQAAFRGVGDTTTYARRVWQLWIVIVVGFGCGGPGDSGTAGSASSTSNGPCDTLTAKDCTLRRDCLLDRKAAGPTMSNTTIGCRAAVGCELRVGAADLGTRDLKPDEWQAEFVKTCEADPKCRYEDRGCFCPCNLSGFPMCNCACGGGLPARCAPR